MNEQKQLRKCIAVDSRANVALIQGKINIYRSNLRELRNYVLAGYHISQCRIKVDLHNISNGSEKFFVSMYCLYSVNARNIL